MNKTYILLDQNNNAIGKEELPTGVLPLGNFREVEEGEDINQTLLAPTLKQGARQKIRAIKDIEDDLTDQKKLIQFMARGFAGLWASLPQDIKDTNPYKDNFDIFSNLIVNNDFRLDLEADQVAKIAKILNDEVAFAEIVNEEYLSKVDS